MKNIYYKHQPCPIEGTKTKCLSEDGIETFEIKNGHFYCNENLISEIDEWDAFDIYIINDD